MNPEQASTHQGEEVTEEVNEVEASTETTANENAVSETVPELPHGLTTQHLEAAQALMAAQNEMKALPEEVVNERIATGNEFMQGLQRAINQTPASAPVQTSRPATRPSSSLEWPTLPQQLEPPQKQGIFSKLLNGLTRVFDFLSKKLGRG